MGRPFDVLDSLPLGEQGGQTFSSLVLLMQRLLAADGCAWDRAQTFATLRQYVLEEACEVMDAIDSGDRAALCEELGDLALQVVFLAELGRAEGSFGPDDVVRGIVTKLVRRHPHVFGDAAAPTQADVERNWARIKAEEKQRRPLLDDIPRSLPALSAAARVSERARTVGFDWEDQRGARAKVQEELLELDEAMAAADPAAIEHEFGDVLFSLVNWGRHLGLQPEVALQKTTQRFRSRFAHVEAEVFRQHGDWPREAGKATRGISLEELESYWQAAKELGL